MVLASGIVLPPQPVTVTVQLEPALNTLNSIGVLKSMDSNPGMSDWAIETYQKLDAERRWQSMLLQWGTGVEAISRLARDVAAEEFPVLLDVLENTDAVALRDTILNAHIDSTHRRVILDLPPVQLTDPDKLLADQSAFQTYLEGQYGKELEDLEFFSEFHALLNDPQTLKDILLDYLHYVWETYVAAEWERVRPELEAVVSAYDRLDLNDLSLNEAMRVIIGRDLSTVLDLDALNQFDRICFMPSLHNGPYITTFGDHEILYILYGARMPSGLIAAHITLDRAELLHRLKSLADEMRLRIVYILSERGELSTGEIMDIFDLNKSAASRHLRSLHASGLVIERRDTDNKSKFYSLNPEVVGGVSAALAALVP